MSVKLTKISTPMRCKYCQSNTVVGGHDGLKTVYRCNSCDKTWECEEGQWQIRQIPIQYGKCNNVFYGPWLDYEMQMVLGRAFKDNERTYDEWGWYKGRHFYTAWRLGDSHIILNHGLMSLIGKVAELCKLSRSL